MLQNYTGFGVALLLILTSCNITKHIGEEEQLLTENQIVFEKGYKIENRTDLKTEMQTLYKQVPNEKVLLFFKARPWLFIKLKNSEADTINETSLEKAIRRIAHKRFAEPPAIFEEELMEKTRQGMEYFLHNRGYFGAEVETTVYTPPEGKKRQRISKKIEVTYLVKPKEQMKIGQIEFYSRDTAIHRILNETALSSFFKPGSPVDGRLYDSEVNRITTMLRNKGYARFSSNYIANLEGDSTDNKTNIKIEVLPASKGKNHTKFTVGKIRIAPKYDPTNPTPIDTLIGDFYFLRNEGEEFWIKPKVFKDAVLIRPGQLYQHHLLNKTNRKLSDLGAYNFINIRQNIDSIREDVINFDILLSPRQKFETGYDIEPNWTERSLPQNQVNNLLGLATGLYFGNKNTFRGAEYLSTSLYAGFEFDVNRNNNVPLLNTIDLKANADLNIPRFNDYFGLYKLLKKSKLIRRSFYNNLRERGRTKIRLGYNYLSLFDFYNLHSFNTGYGYDLQNRYSRFLINNLAIDLLRPEFQANFQPQLDANLFLKNSFGDQLFSGFLFRDLSYIFNSRTNRFGERTFFQLNTEISGAEVYGVNKLYNTATSRQDTFRLGNSLEFSQYAKVEFDIRYTRKFNPRHAAAVRFYTGLGRPFGFSSNLPYLKQFYAGGPNSVRAWSAREVGPGSYRDPLTVNPNNSFRFYQTGDFKLEINGEYRFHLFKFFIDYQGAIFLDIGNVWTFEDDPQRPGGQLTWNTKKANDGSVISDNFLKELAVGTGFGFRLDFSYFLLRLDIGVPLKNNYRTTLSDGQTTYWAYSEGTVISTQLLNYNLGFNYPF